MIPFIAIFAILCIIFMLLVKRSNRSVQKKREQFWQTEREADSVRKQDISHLDYIYIPMELLPFGTDPSPEVQKLETTIRTLDSAKILNLGQYTNTELKLQYGVANLPFLSECDDRYTQLVRALYQWACLLLEHDHLPEAIQVARCSIDLGSDVAGCYYMLCDYYASVGDTESIHRLQTAADHLTGLQADSIKDYLNKSLT